MLQLIDGFQVIVNDKKFGEYYKRSWWDRLFTLPWQPHIANGFDPNAGDPVVKDGQILRMNDMLIMSSKTLMELKRYVKGDQE